MKREIKDQIADLRAKAIEQAAEFFENEKRRNKEAAERIKNLPAKGMITIRIPTPYRRSN